MYTCGLSGRLPAHPVVTRSGGVLYEKSLIESYIDQQHRCPVTGESLERSDLIELRQCTGGLASQRGEEAAFVLTTPTSRSLSTSPNMIPTLLEHLQAEWSSLQLEQYTLRQELAQTKLELAHALHKNEAACRVVARLSQHFSTSDPCKENSNALPEPVVAVLNEQAERRLAAGAPKSEKRARSNNEKVSTKSAQSTSDVVRSLVLEASFSPSTIHPDRNDLGAAESVEHVVHPYTAHCGWHADETSRWACFGSADGSLHLVDAEQHLVYAGAGAGHTDRIQDLLVAHTAGSSNAETPRLFSASDDKSVKVWEVEGLPGESAQPPRKKTQREKNSVCEPQLVCRNTLRYTHGVRRLGQSLLGGGQYLVAGGGVHSPHLYFSDVEVGAHIAVCDVGRQDLGIPSGSCLDDLCLHPLGSAAALLLRSPGKEGYAGLWEQQCSGASVVALWDLKTMMRDTVLPLSPPLLLSASARDKAAASGAIATSIDIAPDLVTMAVGLSYGGVLVWDLRKLQSPLTYLDSPNHADAAVGSADWRPSSVHFTPEGGAVLAVSSGSKLSFYSTAELTAASSRGDEGSVIPTKQLSLLKEGVEEEEENVVSRSVRWSSTEEGGWFLTVGSYNGVVTLCGKQKE